MKLIDICIKAFKNGDDCFGETPTGNIREITYVKILKQYMVTIELELNGEKSHTDIGIVELVGPENYRVHSGSYSFYTKRTPELQKELSKAIEVEM
jgi:hypothetical protein